MDITTTLPKETLLQEIGDWFEGLFNESEKLYNELTEDEKAAAQWGSGLIAVISKDLDAIPADVVILLQQKFPTLSLTVVQGFLDQLIQKISNVQNKVPLTLEDAIAAVQTYFKQYTGSTLSTVLNDAYIFVTLLFTPTTAVEKIINLAVYVYQAIVKPHVNTPTT